MSFSKVVKRIFLEPVINPYKRLWSGIVMYHRTGTDAILFIRCKKGKLVITEDYVWLAIPNFNKTPGHDDCRLPRSAILGVQVDKGFGVSHNLIIHAKGCKEIKADWIQPKAMISVVNLLGQWNENMSFGTMQEVIEYYLSSGYELLSRDTHGAQLRKSLGVHSVGIAVPTPLVTAAFSTRATSNYILVYVRADGSVIKRK